MALQTSGSISLLQIQAGLGGSSPASLQEYYRGGSYTSSSGQGNGNIPTSGAIDMTDFYGADNTPAYTPSWHYCSASGSGSYSFASDSNGDYYAVAISDSGDPNSPFAGLGTIIGKIACSPGTTTAYEAGIYQSGGNTALSAALVGWDIHSSRGGTNNEVMAPTSGAGNGGMNGGPIWKWGVSRNLSIFGGSMSFQVTVKRFF